IFLGVRRAEQCKNSVAGGLNDITIVVMHRVDHPRYRGIYDCARILRIEVLDQFHRAFHVRKERGYELALALEGTGANLASGRSRFGPGGGGRQASQRGPALPTEFETVGVLKSALRAEIVQRRGTIAAELHPAGIFGATLAAAHSGDSSRPTAVVLVVHLSSL